MARNPKPELQPVYEAAEFFVNECLRRRGSLFVPGKSVWVPELASELEQKFVSRLDERPEKEKAMKGRGPSFEDSLKALLQDATPDSVQLLAEMYYVYLLGAVWIKPESKEAMVNRVLQSADLAINFPVQIARGFQSGFAKTGIPFNTYRPHLIAFLVRFMKAWGNLSGSLAQETLLQSPWDFEQFVLQIPAPRAQSQVELLLHIVHPSSFEDICSADKKRMIQRAFADRVSDRTGSINQQLLEIRRSFEPDWVGSFSFYDDRIRKDWDESSDGDSDVGERETMKQLAPPFSKIFPTFDSAWNAFELIKQAALKLGVKGPEDKRLVVTTPAAAEFHFTYCRWLILGFHGGKKWRFGFTAPSEDALRFANIVNFAYKSDHFEQHVSFVKEMVEDPGNPPEEYMVLLRDALPRIVERFQGEISSSFFKFRNPQLMKAVFNEEIRQEVLTGTITLEADEDAEEELDAVPATVDNNLFLPPAEVTHLVSLLRTRKNLILQGAPGTGKTFIARGLAYQLMGEKDDTRVQMVQFHQSYSYEDFVQGLRPLVTGGFALRDGPFVRFCNMAKGDPSRKYVFIIDEINRGNLSRIFGELMMLIEHDKRTQEHALPLTYSDESAEKFWVPGNVHLLGLMNTADRSLALVDYALRRRFAFYPMRPQFESDGFRKHHEEAGTDAALIKRIVSRMTALNNKIAADKANLGEGFCIGHSFFTLSNGQRADFEWYECVVNTELAPLLREYWFDQPDEADAQIKLLLAEV